MYIIEKVGVYSHGVFWIGDDLEEAKEKADEYAANDKDDHHEWDVCVFNEIPLERAKGDAEHIAAYTVVKGKQ